MTVSMLQGPEGFQRKEFDKMMRWLETESRFDVVNLPFTLLISLARPLRDAVHARSRARFRAKISFSKTCRSHGRRDRST
jgi:hypothetical protein